jgi:hypothetical protein
MPAYFKYETITEIGEAIDIFLSRQAPAVRRYFQDHSALLF